MRPQQASGQTIFQAGSGSIAHHDAPGDQCGPECGNAAYIGAIEEFKAEGLLPQSCQRRPVKYLNNIVEQDHRFIKRRVKPGLGVSSHPTAWRTIRGYETMSMIRKGQAEGVAKGNIRAQNQFMAELFGLTA